MNLLLMALAGGLGAACRFLVDQLITTGAKPSLPVATLVINVLGAFALGVVSGSPASLVVRLVLGVGFCGGFTTFSTASVELVRLWDAGRRLAAVGIAVAMLVLAVLAGGVGLSLGHLLGP